MSTTHSLIFSCIALAVLTFIVGFRLFVVRISEMRINRIPPQSIATSSASAQKMQDQRASDNYKHLFELPVLFYALSALAIAVQHVPSWLPVLAWIFVASRVLHSAIQCTYNKVMHRFPVFMFGLVLLFAMWLAFAVSLLAAM